jgi:hypothetical protein
MRQYVVTNIDVLREAIDNSAQRCDIEECHWQSKDGGQHDCMHCVCGCDCSQRKCYRHDALCKDYKCQMNPLPEVDEGQEKNGMKIKNKKMFPQLICGATDNKLSMEAMFRRKWQKRSNFHAAVNVHHEIDEKWHPVDDYESNHNQLEPRDNFQ